MIIDYYRAWDGFRLKNIDENHPIAKIYLLTMNRSDRMKFLNFVERFLGLPISIYLFSLPIQFPILEKIIPFFLYMWTLVFISLFLSIRAFLKGHYIGWFLHGFFILFLLLGMWGIYNGGV